MSRRSEVGSGAAGVVEAKPDLGRLFGARSVALVGASERSNYARNLVANLQGCGFDGEIHLVHPTQERQFDLPCHPSLLDVPGRVDVVYLLTGPDSLEAILADCGRKEVPWAVALSGGFKELGANGAERQASLAEASRANGVSLIGPNSLGFLSSSNRLGAFGSPLARPLLPGALGLVSHSGQLATHIHRLAVDRGIGMSHAAAIGNSAMLSAVDVIEFMLEDKETRVIAALLETIEPAGRFVAAARHALQAGKPLVVLKVGRTQRTRRVAIAHTGVLAGEDRVVDGVLRQLGVIRVAEPEQLLEVGGLLATKGWPKGAGTAVLTGSGGASGVIADLIEGTRVDLREPSETTRAALAELVEGFGVAQNPMDLTGFLGDPAVYGRAAAMLAADPAFDTVVTILDPPGEPSPSSERRLQAARVATENTEAAGKYGIVSIPVAGAIRGLARVAAAEHGVWYSDGLGRAVHALDKAIGYADARARLLAAGHQHRELRIGPELLTGPPGPLTEERSLRLLERAGLPIPRAALARNSREAREQAERLGFPIVLKVQSADVPHKTDVGGVLLGVTDGEAAEAAFEAIVENVSTQRPDARIEGVLVAEQIDAVAELLVGVSHDEQFGPVVTLGAGGKLSELLDDVAIRVPPLTRADVEDMLRQLRVSRLLAGHRGTPPGDVEALIAAVIAISDLALATADSVRELDVNPLLVRPTGQGVVAGDGLVVLR